MIHWLHPQCEWLRGCARDEFSQFGEDGLVDAIFGRIGLENRHAFECGGHDGLTYSNTARLKGWSCLLVERDEALSQKAKENRPDAVHVCGDITLTGVDGVLLWAEMPRDLDLLVIDIDGQDYWIVHDMEFTPRVLMVEYECPDRGSPPPERGDTSQRQAGSAAVQGMLEAKGYTVVVRTDCNAIAVRDELFPLLT